MESQRINRLRKIEIAALLVESLLIVYSLNVAYHGYTGSSLVDRRHAARIELLTEQENLPSRTHAEGLIALQRIKEYKEEINNYSAGIRESMKKMTNPFYNLF